MAVDKSRRNGNLAKRVLGFDILEILVCATSEVDVNEVVRNAGFMQRDYNRLDAGRQGETV